MALKPHLLTDAMIERMDIGERKSRGLKTRLEAIEGARIQFERDLRKQLVNYLAIRGIIANKTRMDKPTTDTISWPDLTFAIFGKAIAWELKMPGLEPTSEQMTLHDKLRLPPNNWSIAIIHSLLEAQKFLDDWKVPRWPTL